MPVPAVRLPSLERSNQILEAVDLFHPFYIPVGVSHYFFSPLSPSHMHWWPEEELADERGVDRSSRAGPADHRPTGVSGAHRQLPRSFPGLLATTGVSQGTNE